MSYIEMLVLIAMIEDREQREHARALILWHLENADALATTETVVWRTP